MQVVKLKSATKDYIWGGKKLCDWGFTPQSKNGVIAEAWVLSFHKDGMSRIEGTNAPLCEIAAREDWGSVCSGFKDFPVLVKLIDSADNLSVQVHPSDEYALLHEGQFGKTEMWYVLESEAGAGLYVGFKRSVTKKELTQAVKNGTVLELMNFFPVKRGDCYFIPSGTMHAIGKGCTIAEVQQNSNVTYRVFDYNRVGAYGKPRELHIEKAIAVTDLSAYTPQPRQGNVLANCKYFTAESGEGERKIHNTESFVSVLSVANGGSINGQPMMRGDSWFIPAGQSVQISGNAEYILTYIKGE